MLTFCKSMAFLIGILCLIRPVKAVDRDFDSNGVKIRYVSEGQGDPVVLLHGWISDSSMWGRLDTNPGSKEFQLIALDLRGHGKSDRPHDSAKYGPEMAEDVVRLLNHLKLPKAHLVGYSMGAFVASQIVAKYPDRVLSVVYGGQAPLLEDSSKTDAAEVDLFAKTVEEGKDLGAYIIGVTPPGKKKPSAEQAKALAAILFNGKDVKALAAAGRSFKSMTVTMDELKKCPAPILFVHGSLEADSTKERVALIRKSIGRSELKVVEGADHITTLTRKEFGSAVSEFIKANKQK